MESIVSFFIALLLAPLFPGFILKVKAFFAGKQGPPLLIKYYTVIKLLKKGSVYSKSTTFIFGMGPTVGFCTAAMALLFFPLAGAKPVLSFQGDVILLFYLMALGRFFTVLAAMDVASPFEGMGAVREVWFGTLAEATVFTVLIIFYRLNGSLSLGGFFSGPDAVTLMGPAGALLLLVVLSLFIVLLTENSRVPVDDPATHLELTMIHEVMILDHSGPDLALIELGSFFKLLFYAAFITAIVQPLQLASPWANGLLFYGIVILIYMGVGVTESIMARFKMNNVPKFILTSFVLVFFAAILSMRYI